VSVFSSHVVFTVTHGSKTRGGVAARRDRDSWIGMDAADERSRG
jgi:hypothetical protein